MLSPSISEFFDRDQNVSYKIFNTFELCTVKVYDGQCSFFILGVYRPPGSGVREFIDELQSILMENFSSDVNMIIAGDFNIDLNSNTNYCGDFMNMLVGMSFVSLITEPTRCTDTSNTLIDHIWSNMDRNFHSFVFKLRVTDHFLTLTSFKSIKKNKFTIKKFRDHSALSVSRFGTMFQEQFSFDNLVMSTSTFDELIENFNAEVFRIYNICCPLRTKQYSTNRLLNPWLTDEIIRFVKFKHFLVSQVKSNYIPKYILNNFKQELRKKIEASKKSYYSMKFKAHKNDIKKTWDDLKNISGMNSACSMTEIALTDHEDRSIPFESVPEFFAARYREQFSCCLRQTKNCHLFNSSNSKQRDKGI